MPSVNPVVENVVTMCFPFRWDGGEHPTFSPFATQKDVAHFAYWNWLEMNARITYDVESAPQYSKSFDFTVVRQFNPDTDIKDQIATYTGGQTWNGSQLIVDGSDEYSINFDLSFFREHFVGNDFDTGTQVPAMYVTANGSLWRPSFSCGASINVSAGAEFAVALTSFITPEDTTEYDIEFNGNLSSAQFGSFLMHGFSGLNSLVSASLLLRPITLVDWS